MTLQFDSISYFLHINPCWNYLIWDYPTICALHIIIFLIPKYGFLEMWLQIISKKVEGFVTFVSFPSKNFQHFHLIEVEFATEYVVKFLRFLTVSIGTNAVQLNWFFYFCFEILIQMGVVLFEVLNTAK